jgi:hypothetical protein
MARDEVGSVLLSAGPAWMAKEMSADDSDV